MFQRLAALRQRWRVWCWRTVAETCGWLSTIEAKNYLRKNGRIAVLIDNATLGHGTTHEMAWIDTGTQSWGSMPIASGYSARVPIHSPNNETRTYREVTYLIGIAELARAGLIELVISAELYAERLRHPIGRFEGYGWDDLNIFHGIPLRSVDGYVLDLEDAKSRQLERLTASSEEPFNSIASLLPKKSNLDAWHIHTAHKHNLFCFLALDFHLAEDMERASGKIAALKLNSRSMLPSELGQALGLRPILSYMISYRGARWPVHPELHVPNETRTSPRRRKQTSITEETEREMGASIVQFRAKKVHGMRASHGHEAVKVQYEDYEGRTCELDMKLSDALYLLTLLKSAQLELDIPFPDDPRDPNARPIRPSERSGHSK